MIPSIFAKCRLSMPHNINRRSMIVRLIATAMFALPCFQLTAGANSFRAPDGNVMIVQSAPFGLARGQVLRITGLNTGDPVSRNPDGRKYKMLVAFLVEDGSVVGQSDEFTIEPGEFHSFDFDRDDLPLAGEPGTGRVQLSAEVRYRFFSLVDRTRATTASLEIIDKSSGRTTAAQSQKPKEIVVVGSNGNNPGNFTAEFASIGITPGQLLRFSLLNPNDPSRAGRRESILASVRLFDADGVQIAQSPVVAIPAGEFRSFDFNRDDLSVAGEPITGRLQSKGSWSLIIQDAASDDGELPASVEVVDRGSGVSTAGYQTVIKIKRNANPV